MKYQYIIPILALFFSCNKDVEGITIQGIVYNTNKEPINNITVTIVCWKYGNSPDESYSENEIKVVVTDSEGKYKVNFDRGAFVEVEISLKDCVIGYEAREIYVRKNVINVLNEK